MTHLLRIFSLTLTLTLAFNMPITHAQTHAVDGISESQLAGAPKGKPAKAVDKAGDPAAHDHAGHDHPAPKPIDPNDLPEIDFIFSEAPEDHVIGAADAPVTIIGYASVTCPHCGQWFTSEWPKFKAKHIDTGDVRFVMREYPTQPQMLARAGFAIMNCAPEDEYFSHLVGQMQSQDRVFQAMRENKVQQVYEAFAVEAGLSTPEALQQCLMNKNIQTRIDRSILRAHKGGLQGVPNFIMDGVMVDGDISADGLSEKVTAILSGGVSGLPTDIVMDQDVTPYESKPNR